MSAPTPDQAALLAAIVDTLVPADENGPSGSDAGVDTYIAGAIAANEELRNLYVANLEALEALAGERFDGAGFSELDPERCAELLCSLEAGEATGFTPDAATFFAILHHNMLEGMFGDPEHGGNVDFAGWKLVGYRGVKLVQSHEDQRIGPIDNWPMRGRREAIEAEGPVAGSTRAEAGL